MKRKAIASLLAILMVFVYMPVFSYADSTDPVEEVITDEPVVEEQSVDPGPDVLTDEPETEQPEEEPTDAVTEEDVIPETEAEPEVETVEEPDPEVLLEEELEEPEEESQENSTELKSEEVVYIYTIEDLDNIRNDLSGDYVLENDLDLTAATKAGGKYYNSGKGWRPIGSSDFFTGTFDGQGHTIKGLYSKGTSGNNGLFGINDGTISNLTIQGGKLQGDSNMVGVIAGGNYGTIRNCVSNCTIDVDGDDEDRKVGGITGVNQGTVADCENRGSITVNGDYDSGALVGGLVGYNKGPLRGINSGNIELLMDYGDMVCAGGIAGFSSYGLIDCSNSGEVGSFGTDETEETYAGGIVGSTRGSVYDCTNSGKVYAGNSMEIDAGGIIGYIEPSSGNDVYVHNCFNTGVVDAYGYYELYIGGIVGSVYGTTIMNCGNSGKVSADSYSYDDDGMVGGVAGYLDGKAVLADCYNTGVVVCYGEEDNVWAGAGGVVGGLWEGAVIESYNTGKITGGSRTGGIVALNWDAVMDCYNTGRIIGNSSANVVGGVVGGNFTGGQVANVYNVGYVTGGQLTPGGVVGSNRAQVGSGAYTINWNTYAVGAGTKTGTRLSMASMKKSSSYSSFDFDEVWVMGTGSYKLPILRNVANADKQRSYKISLAYIKATLSSTAYKYTGSAIKPKVTITGLTSGTDYTVTYSNNKNVGKAKVVIKGKGSYTGSRTLYFKINPQGTTLKTPAPASKAITVKWTKQAKKMSTSYITGYQIQIATNSKFTKNKKTVKVAGYSKTSRKITGLKGKTKYYVRIRTYKKVGGVEYYSPWSTVKTVTTKK